MIWNFLIVSYCLRSFVAECSFLDEHLQRKLKLPLQDPISSHSEIYEIYSKSTGGLLQIRGKRVDANGVKGSEHAKIIISSIAYGGHITLRGARSGRFLCINKRGRLQAKRKKSGKRCMFKERMSPNFFDTFTNVKNQRWLIGFQKRNGKPKRGQKTSFRQNAVMFLKWPLNRTSKPSSSSYFTENKWKSVESSFKARYFANKKTKSSKMMGDDPRSLTESSFYTEEELARRKKLISALSRSRFRPRKLGNLLSKTSKKSMQKKKKMKERNQRSDKRKKTQRKKKLLSTTGSSNANSDDFQSNIETAEHTTGRHRKRKQKPNPTPNRSGNVSSSSSTRERNRETETPKQRKTRNFNNRKKRKRKRVT